MAHCAAVLAYRTDAPALEIMVFSAQQKKHFGLPADGFLNLQDSLMGASRFIDAGPPTHTL